MSLITSSKFAIAALAAAAAMSAQAAGNLDRADAKFLNTAAGSGMFEVEVSKLAVQKATNPEVKSYAQMLVDHHTAANQELMQVASSKQVTPPAEIPRAMRSKIDKLSKKNGADFDREYIEEVGLDDHKTDIKLFRKESEKGKDPEVKAFATKTLPVLQQHYDAAQKLRDVTKNAKTGKNAGRTS